MVLLSGACAAPARFVAFDPPPASLSLERAEPGDGLGGLTKGARYVVVTGDGVRVYRLFDGTSAKRWGRYWTEDDPRKASLDGAPSRSEALRRRFAVCRAWNAFTQLQRCTLRSGAVIIRGPGATVVPPTCKSRNPDGTEAPTNESYPAGAVQIVVPTDGGSQPAVFAACDEPVVVSLDR